MKKALRSLSNASISRARTPRVSLLHPELPGVDGAGGGRLQRALVGQVQGDGKGPL